MKSASAWHRDDHHVHFYNNDDVIAEAVGAFLEPGFKTGQPILLISTIEHRETIYMKLRAKGCNILEARLGGRLDWLDARETLARFMVDGMPDAQLFTTCIGDVFEHLRLRKEHLSIRAFGEMVDLLLADGNPDGAIRLEELWNGLGPEFGFSLFCAYSMGNLVREEHWRYFQMVCDQHVTLPDETIQGIHDRRHKQSA